ncbi:MAG: hypothetical protein U9Q03_02245 [Patescibacteria group bacterium]|nr:hypothetical protein [Patescibacteria group bacterium]
MTVVLLMNGFVFAPSANAESLDAYRWRIDDGDEINASWAADENTTADIPRNTHKRLRVGVSNSGSDTELLKSAAEAAGIGEDFLRAGFVDGGYAYFGTYTKPGQVIKVDLSTFTRVGLLTLSSGDDEIATSVLDASGATHYAYFGCNTNPGRVVKVNLATFTRTGAIDLGSGEDMIASSAIDTSAGYVYFGTFQQPAKVAKVNLSTFTQVGSALSLSVGENDAVSMVTDSTDLYVGTATAPGKVVKVSLSTFTRTGALTLNAGESDLYGAVIDTSLGYAYFSTFTSPGQVVRVGLSGFTHGGTLTFYAGENSPMVAAIDTSAATHYAYFGTSTNPGMVVKVNLTTWVEVGTALTLNSDEPHLYSVAMDSSGGHAYFGTFYGTPGKIVKVQLSNNTRIGSISYGSGGENRIVGAAIDSTGTYAYFGTDTMPGKVIKVQLSDMSVVDSVTLQSAERGIWSLALDDGNGYLYAGTNTIPGRVVKIRVSDMARIGAITLSSGEDMLRGAVIDESSGYVYFATYTAPTKVVKVNINTFGRDSVVTFNSGEDYNYGAAAIDTANGYAYFGTYTTPARVVRVGLSPFARDSVVTLNSGEDKAARAVIDTSGGYAYFGMDTDPARIVKVNTSTFGRDSALTLNSGESYIGALGMDPVNGFLYAAPWWNFPGNVVKVKMSDMSRVSSLALDAGENRIYAAVSDVSSGHVYFATYTNPTTLFKISVTPKYQFRLEYALKETTCAAVPSWTQVPTIETTEHFAMYPSSNVTNGEPTTNLAGVSDGNTNFHPGVVMTNSSQTPEISLGVTEFTEVEYSVEATDYAQAQQAYCFRLTDAGTPLDSYTNYIDATDQTEDPTLSNSVLLDRLAASATSVNVRVEFTLQNTLDGTLTVTFPGAFTVTAAPTSGSGCLSAFGYTATTMYATKTSCSGAIYFTGGTVTNPNTPGAYEITWVNDDPGGTSVYITDDDQISVSSDVDPTVSFNIGTSTSCDGTFSGNGGTLALGSLTTSSVTTSDVSGVNHICTRLSTNASAGAIVTATSLYGALTSTSVPADTIDSATATLVAGTEGYGICVGSDGAHTGEDSTTPAGASPSAQSPFSSTCNSTTHNVGVLTTGTQTVWSISGPSQNAFARVFMKAAIAGATPAHDDYTDTVTFIATATY